jgi:hypothetical protein
LAQKKLSCFKLKKRKQGMAQVIEHLPSKHKALSSNAEMPKNKK